MKPMGGTPGDQDTPQNIEREQQGVAALEGFPQPVFGSDEAEAEAGFISPAKTVFTHNRETGETCTRGLNARMDADHWDVPGKSTTDPVIVDTPSRDKK